MPHRPCAGTPPRLDRPARLARPGSTAAGALAVLGLLAACAPPRPVPPPSPDALSGGPPLCRIGPDGGPPKAGSSRTADRGIGGTGAPAAPGHATGVRAADRGIGGTGAASGPAGAGPLVADRGIGGTGIVAVITGFASVCLAGQEVALDPDVPVRLGDRPAAAGDLRAGQVALIDAAGTAGAGLRARRVTVRYEVTGPVQAAEQSPGGGMLRVAGQPVAVPDGAAGSLFGVRPAVGDWVAVSGLRRPDGVVEATRIDRVAPGEVVVHGRLEGSGGALRIGALPVRPVPGIPVPAGRDVVAVGRLEGGVLRAEQLAPDLLASDPAALFGIGIGGLLVETFAVVDGGRVRFGQGFTAGYAAGAAIAPGNPRRAVLALERAGDGGLRATGLRPDSASTSGSLRPGLSGASSRVGSGPGSGPGSGRGDGPAAGAAPASRFEPAPVPDRTLRAPGEGGSRVGDRAGRGAGGRAGDPARSGDGLGRGRAGDAGEGRDGAGPGSRGRGR